MKRVTSPFLAMIGGRLHQAYDAGFGNCHNLEWERELEPEKVAGAALDVKKRIVLYL